VTAVIRPRARDDITRQFRWYLVDQDAPDAAFRFLDAIQMTIDRITETPGIGAPKQFKNPVLAGLRSCPVDGFGKIRVYYLADGKDLRVIRILHGARDIGAVLESEDDDGATG
jgi:plasmid stabilization system protein ParE